MKSDKSVIVLFLMLSLSEALLNETSTYFQSRKILGLQLSKKFEVTGIIETAEIGEKGNKTCTKQNVIWKESCFLAKSDLAKRDNCQILDFHYRVDGEYYKYEYSNAGFTCLNSSKNEMNCLVSMEIDGKHLNGLRSAVVSRRNFLNGGGHGSYSTRTAKAVTKFKDDLFKDSKDFESNKISRKQRVSDSGRRTSAELPEHRYKRRIAVLSKSIKDRNRMAVRRHHERMKTISTSHFRMRLDRRIAANVRNKNEDGPLEIIYRLRRKVPKEDVDMSSRRNFQTRTQVSVLRESYLRREKSDESKDTSHRTVSPVRNEVRNENKELSQKRVFQRRTQSNTETRGDSRQKMLLLSNEARQVFGGVLQKRIFKSRKEVRDSREKKVFNMKNEVINEIEDNRQNGIGQERNEVRKIVRGHTQGILQSKNEVRNTISSARTSDVETRKGVDRRLGTTHFNEARSRFKRNFGSNYFHPGEDFKNKPFRPISDSEDDAINEFMIERTRARINIDLNGRNTRRLSNTRGLRQLIRNRSGNLFIPRRAINRRMLKRAHIFRVGMRKRQSTGMSVDSRYFVKRKSRVDLRHETVRELSRNRNLIKFENLANRGNMIDHSKERSRKNSTRECRNCERLISLRQFSSVLHFSEILSNAKFRNVNKIIPKRNRTSQRLLKIAEQETYLDNNSTFASSLSTSTQRHINIVALSAGRFEKRTPVSILCCRFIQKFENESHVNSVDSKRPLNLSDSDLNKWPRLTNTDLNYSEFAGLIPVTGVQQVGNLITSLGLAMTSIY